MSAKAQTNWTVSILAAALLAACGGGALAGESASTNATAATASKAVTAHHQRDRRAFRKLIVFGDSLSDVGTYRTAGIAAVGGGEYTVNGRRHRNWTARLASDLDLKHPCSARTGLNSVGPLALFAQPVADHAGCFNYAQGGARVTNPIGPWNAALLALGDASGALGQLTDPIIEQINRHLTKSGGRFAATDLVTVLAGGNDVFMNLAALQAGASPEAAVIAMGQAGAELAGYVSNLIVANGAKRVVVVNLPDVGTSIFARGQPAQTQGLISLMSSTFNAQLAAGVSGTQGVLLVDAFTTSRDQIANPAKYGLSNVNQTACDLARTPFPASLVCSKPGTVIPGNIRRYAFSDTVHPTPYGYRLLAGLVVDRMRQSGWLGKLGGRGDDDDDDSDNEHSSQALATR